MFSFRSFFRSIKISKIVIADLQILGSSFCFGIGFLGQRALSVDGLGPMTCNALRFGISTILIVACLPFIPPDFDPDDSEDDEDDDAFLMSPVVRPKKVQPEHDLFGTIMQKMLGPYGTGFTKFSVWYWGVYLGLINFIASGFLQWGMANTTASKAAFITGFDLFLTPIFALFIPTFKHNAKTRPSTWFAVFVSMVGLFLLSGSRLDDFELGIGESLTLVSTVFWTLHITYTDIATNYVDSASMICVQLGFVTFLSSLGSLFFEPGQDVISHLALYFPWLIFLAIAEALAFVLMAMGQNLAPATDTAIILSLEGVFAAGASFLFLGEHLSARELWGCVLMLGATLVAEIGLGSIENRLSLALGMGPIHSHHPSHPHSLPTPSSRRDSDPPPSHPHSLNYGEKLC